MPIIPDSWTALAELQNTIDDSLHLWGQLGVCVCFVPAGPPKTADFDTINEWEN